MSSIQRRCVPWVNQSLKQLLGAFENDSDERNENEPKSQYGGLENQENEL